MSDYTREAEMALEMVRIANERDALAAQVERLKEELHDRLAQTRCGCEHPACRRCQDDAETERVLSENLGVSLASLKARWQADAISQWAAQHLGGQEQELAEIYASKLRHQAAGEQA